MPHVRLTSLLTARTVNSIAQQAADRLFDEGGSPRVQIDAARAASGKRMAYLPHAGEKQRAKAAKRAAAKGNG